VAVVIYDSDCGFCRFTLALLLFCDRRSIRRSRSAASYALRPLPLGTAEADRLLADLTAAERNASWHLLIDADEPASPGPPERFSAGAALAPTLALLSGGRIPAALLSRAPHLTERAYLWVADHRGPLGRFVGARARRWADRVIAAHGAVP
jgi:predicted DCC family thiol-disulfide oxidoreductase YuxK